MPAPIRREQLSNDLPVGATKDPCRLATTADDTLSGLAVRDGITPVAGDRVLVKAQTTGSQNGIYTAAAGAWTRAIDFDEDADADSGTLVGVIEGTANAGTSWMLTTSGVITLGVTVLTFSIIGNAGVDPGAHGTDHDPGGADAVTTAVAAGLDGNTANAEGVATSLARSDHTHAIDDTTGTNSTVNAGDTAADGTAIGFSKKDHQHAVATGAPTGAVEIGDTGVEGVSADLARSDHIHPVAAPAAPANVTKAAAAAGTAVEAARADHKHDVTTATAVAITDSTSDEGVSTSLSRADHGHAHGVRGGGTQHAAATTSVAGFLSAVDKTKLDSLQDAAGIDAKESCRVRAQGNLTLSGEQTIDGILTNLDRVLVTQQTTATEDGIYLSAAGAWARTGDVPTGAEARGWHVAIEEGTADSDKIFLITNNEGSDIIGTDGLTDAAVSGGTPRGAGAGLILNGNDLDVVANGDGSIVVNPNDIQVGVLATDAQHGVRGGGTQHANVIAAGAAGFITGADKTKLDGIEALAEVNDTPQQERVTTQTVNGTDTALTDTLNATPVSNASVVLFFNGVMMIQGAGEDYTISGSTITWLASTGTAEDMKTSDDLVATYLS